MSLTASAERKLLTLEKINGLYNIEETSLSYIPEIKRKDCNTIGMLFEDSLKDATLPEMSLILKDYQTDDERAFWWGNHAFSFLIKNYNISSKKDVCFVIIAKQENFLYLFKIPTNTLKKLSLRDFGSKDNQIIAKALDLDKNRVPSNLPYPLSKAFSYIKVGKLAISNAVLIDMIEDIKIDNKLTKKYQEFLNDYSFDYLGFDESKLDTAYDNLALQSMQDEMIAEEQRKIAKQKIQRKNQLKDSCSIYYGSDLNVYNACIGRAEHLYEGNYGLMAKYIVQGRCDYVSGIDNTQLSYICKYPKTSSCSVLYDNYSDKVIDACLRCKGSRRWLAEFAASMIKRKIIPTCY